MSYRYSLIQKFFIKLYRVFRPSVDSPYTVGQVDDICSIKLVNPEKMQDFFIYCIELMKEVRNGDVGDYLEFGVFNGTSLSNMYFAAQKAGVDMRFFGFDSFEGLPEESEREDAGVFKKGFYTCSFEQLQECLERKNVDESKITWVKGWYEDTLNQGTIDKYNITNPGIIFIDCDTYSSSKTVLDFLSGIIKKPVIISLDDWRLYDLDLKGEGEYRSFNEFLESNPNLEAEEIQTYKRNSRTFLLIPQDK